MRLAAGKVRRLTAVLAAGRRWLRSCADCRAYLHFETGPDAGKVETYPRPDGKGGAIHLPVVRPAEQDPPCDECPKIGPDDPKHWDHATEFAPWFWEVLEDFQERQLCGTLATADPLMMKAFLVLDQYAERCRARAAAGPVVDALVQIFCSGV